MVGGLVTLFGRFAPFMIFGSCLSAIGCGLIYTFTAQSPASIWLGYQILTGIAFGLSFQTPIMAAQALAAYEDVATTTAILYCTLPIKQHILFVRSPVLTFTQSSKSSEPQFSYPPESPSSLTC
jgi:formate/nitrite transporter FocA (FNT family)